MSNYNHKYLERKVKPGGGYIYVYREKDQPQKDKIYLDKLPEGTNISDVEGIYLSKWGNSLARVKTTNRYTERYGQGKDFFDVNTLRQKYLVRETANVFARVGSVSDKFALGPEKEYWVKVKLKELTPEQFTAVERKLKDNGFKEVYGGNIDKITEKQFKSVINKTYSDIQNNEDSNIANAVDRIVSDIGKKEYGDNWDYSEDKMNIIWNSLPGIYILNKVGDKFKYIVVKKGEAAMEKSFQKLVKSVWTNQYINDLPDSAFLYIELGGKKDESGKTVPRDLRHFPYMNINGKIDLAHIRNAIARIPQSKCGLSAKEMEALQNKAREMLDKANKLNKGEKSMYKDGTAIGTELLKSFIVSNSEKEEVLDLNADLEKGATGGKYIKREPKPGGGYKYFYGEEKSDAEKVREGLVKEKAKKDREFRRARSVLNKKATHLESENLELVKKIGEEKAKKVLDNLRVLDRLSEIRKDYSGNRTPEAELQYYKKHNDIYDEFNRALKRLDTSVDKSIIGKIDLVKGNPFNGNPPVLQPHEWVRRENAMYEREMTRDNTIDLKLIDTID